MGSDAAPTALGQFSWLASPALPRWAKLCRASGAEGVTRLNRGFQFENCHSAAGGGFAVWLLRDEAGDAGAYDWIQALSGLNSVDLVHGVLREGGDVEILSRASRALRCGKQGSAALHGPRQ